MFYTPLVEHFNHLFTQAPVYAPSNPFFKDVIKAWLSFQFKPPETYQDITSQLLWCNSNVLVENKPIIWKKALKRGIFYINDLLDNEGGFLSYNGLLVKFGHVMEKLEYNQILAAVTRYLEKYTERQISNQGPYFTLLTIRAPLL